MLLTAVAIEQVAADAYLLPGYGAKDVYRAEVRAKFPHWRRPIARAFLPTYNVADGFFVRFYAAKDCQIADEAYARIAQALLIAGSPPPAQTPTM